MPCAGSSPRPRAATRSSALTHFGVGTAGADVVEPAPQNDSPGIVGIAVDVILS